MRMASWLGVAATAACALAGVWGTGCASGGSSATEAGGSGASGPGSTSTGSSTTTTSSSGTASSSSTTGSGGGTGGAGSTTTSGSGGGAGGGTGGAGGTVNPGLPLGSNCSMDSDCTSQLCKPVVIDSSSVCVAPCTQQSDCMASGPGATYFCEPVTAGSTAGYCIPHSPADCLSCMVDSDCGSLSEVCFQAPGDVALSCNVDCSIAGAAACPPDYTCTAEMVAGVARQLCRPNLITNCLEAVGGYCDRLSVPQPCIATNSAGMCIGQRTCMQPSERFSDCDAAAPQCLTDCSMQDPAGCTESYCASATSAPTDCGTCGNVCPGYMELNDNVTCNTSQKCTFSCQGENYDVNDNPADGCEVADSPQGNHTQNLPSSPADALNVSDCDDGGIDFTLNGRMPSDKRVHEDPSVVGFDNATGSAPDWLYIYGVGHDFCENNIVMQLCVDGSSSPSCYMLTVITSDDTFTCQVDASGCCPNLDPGASPPENWGIYQTSSGQFSDNTYISIEVQKTCGTNVTENVTYAVTGHL
jgi:hypothetical protein